MKRIALTLAAALALPILTIQSAEAAHLPKRPAPTPCYIYIDVHGLMRKLRVPCPLPEPRNVRDPQKPGIPEQPPTR